MFFPSAEHIAPGRPRSLLLHTEDEDAAPRVEKGVHTLVPFLPFTTVHRHRLELQPLGLQLYKPPLLDQVSQFNQDLVNRFHVQRTL